MIATSVLATHLHANCIMHLVYVQVFEILVCDQEVNGFVFFLVPENEAEEVLLLPDVTELEDWEDWEQPPSVRPTSELESFKHRADSQVLTRGFKRSV